LGFNTVGLCGCLTGPARKPGRANKKEFSDHWAGERAVERDVVPVLTGGIPITTPFATFGSTLFPGTPFGPSHLPFAPFSATSAFLFFWTENFFDPPSF
jgi:hypothetical protein